MISSSNYLVQLPITIFGVHTTWGSFTFPFSFVLTDLTVRFMGPKLARYAVAVVMIPALLLSYAVSVTFRGGVFQGFEQILSFDPFVARIACASMVAFVVGQLIDTQVFSYLRKLKSWWVAPVTSTVCGGIIDTVVFFGTAFYRSANPFMSENWMQLAFVDFCAKIIVSFALFLPSYYVFLQWIQQKIAKTNEDFGIIV